MVASKHKMNILYETRPNKPSIQIHYKTLTHQFNTLKVPYIVWRVNHKKSIDYRPEITSPHWFLLVADMFLSEQVIEKSYAFPSS